jgi:hypothetical protein
VDIRDSRFVIRALGLGVAATFALQPAQAGERKPAAVQAHHLGASIRRVALVAPARSSARADLSKRLGDVNRSAAGGEFSFVPVTPLGAEAGGKRTEPLSPQERKTITFFRLNPKLGDVSVQPIVGGVNGAQLLVGF